jgi:hypothetical protein
MSTRSDLDRLITAWLVSEAPERAPGRLLDASRERIQMTRQRRAWGPAWRIPDMNMYAKLAIAAAAVVVVAVVGISVLPNDGGGGFGAPASPTPSLTTPATPPASAFPASGRVEVGRHRMVRAGVPLSIEFATDGWQSSKGYNVIKGTSTEPDSIDVIFWDLTPDNVYADPCAHTPLDPPATRTRAGLAAAIESIPGIDVLSGPTEVTVGGHPATRITTSVPATAPCGAAMGDFRLWYDEGMGTGGGRWPSVLGSTMRTWIIDVDGTLVWIDAETFEGAAPEIEQEVQALIESIEFE